MTNAKLLPMQMSMWDLFKTVQSSDKASGYVHVDEESSTQGMDDVVNTDVVSNTDCAFYRAHSVFKINNTFVWYILYS